MLEGGFLSSYIDYIIHISNFTRVGKWIHFLTRLGPTGLVTRRKWWKEVGISHTYYMKLLLAVFDCL